MPPEETPLKQIRTFQGDVAEALRKQQSSLVSIQRAQQMKGPIVSAETPSQGSRTRTQFFFLFMGSFILLALGVIGVWYIYTQFISDATTPATAAPANRFVSANVELNLDLATTTRDTFITDISNAVGTVPSGELRHIVLRKATGDEVTPMILLPTSEFMQRLESQAPGSLVRAFDDLFMYGVFGGSATTGRASTFLIIKLASFENAFAGMLLWEPNMSRDIGPLFATARLLTDVPPEAVFTDITDRNKDIRVLRIGDQNVLLYSFFDNNMLIITDNIETLRLLIDRLTREKLSR